MKNNKILFYICFLLLSSIGFIFSCTKDKLKTINPSPIPPSTNPSFTEEFNNVGDLTAKGWVFKNNSDPAGSTGWRQGRYEPAASKFPVPYIGFPAYSSSSTPNDFVSCDGSCVNDIGNISAWLISPKLPMKNGDKISFYTRALDDASFIFFMKDRMQVWANYTDSSSDVGNTDSGTGNFNILLLDINSDYIYNDPLGNPSGLPGYPEAWTKATITLSGLPNEGIANGRFAFRYFGTDAGASSNAANTSSVIGIDQLVFTSN